MRRFLGRIIICLVPTILSIVIVAWAVNEFSQGRGGFRLGVDLVGGTVLVYEVDERKMPENFKAPDLAAALKRRIDPNDLYNITIRPIEGKPPRVEIILPTGGRYQAEAAQAVWEQVLFAAAEEFPIEGKTSKEAYDAVPRGRRGPALLKKRIFQEHEALKWPAVLKEAGRKFPVKGKTNPFQGIPYGDKAVDDLAEAIVKATARTDSPVTLETARAWVEEHKPTLDEEFKERVVEWVDNHTTRHASRALTGNEVDNIKALIGKQGRLEFKVLANVEDDKEAIAAAQAVMAPRPKAADKLREWEANRARLEAANTRAEPPPPPTHEGNREFTASIKGTPSQHTYEWVMIGKSELYSLGLNSEALAKTPELNKAIEAKRKAGVAFTGAELIDNPAVAAEANLKSRHTISGARNNLIFTREIPADQRRLGGPNDSRPPEDFDIGQEKRYEYFLLVRNGIEIKGDDLIRAEEDMRGGGTKGGGKVIAFTFNADGGDRFYELTSQNAPDKSTDGQITFSRQLAIIFDNQIVSAPNLNEPIRTNGQITGDFTQQEINDMVRILRAGALPATLKQQPVSENSMGATLGEDTITKGTWSVLWAFVAVMAFMVFYYRFAGFVACVALLANLLMTVAFMVLVNAAFTLPGLAGLVLMLGMAVDANVLIYERLREERDRGASLGQALRNGYDRALPTILDTHLSSIFTAIVLYVVGNDQLKGFGISLTVGLVISLFTSLYMTRTMFEVWMDEGWLKELNFFEGLVKLVHIRYWDFMSVRHYWFTATAALTVLGAVLFLYRADSDPAAGKATVLNIDFTGGAAITARLAEPHSLAWLRERLETTKEGTKYAKPLPDQALEQIFLSGEERKYEDGNVASDVFTLRTSEKDLDKVKAFVIDRIGKDNLKVLNMAFTPVPEAVTMKYKAPSKADIDKPIVLTFESPRAVEQKKKLETAKAGKEAIARVNTEAKVPLTRVQDAFEAEAKEAGVPIDAFEVKGDGKGQDDQYSQMRLTLKKKVEEPKLVKWLKGTAGRLAAPVMAKADVAKVNLDFTGVNGKEDYASLSQIQTLLNEGFEMVGRSKVSLERPTDPKFHDKASGLDSRLILQVREDMDGARLNEILETVQYKLERNPVPERLEHFDSQLAASIQQRAIIAIVASWIAILLYLWFRFGSWTFGAATVVCLIHDLFFTLGCVAVCHYIYHYTPWLAYPLGIQDFKIDLAAVAALLTLVGYSVNDTIVVFDRIREVRGKNPLLTFQMINDGVNQTLTRTLLASATVLVVVLVLYIWGGEGVKLFSFVMIVGVFVGTYSSIYIASPLLVMFGEGSVHPALQEKPAATARA
jgi:SecD/SecF fusion protein